MTKLPHKLFLASAGTGKTYQLAVHFVGLLLKGVPPERILATTFTRKAAGEILDRVLLHLVEAIEDKGKLAQLEEDLAKEGVSVTREACVAQLATLTRSLDQLKVKTLDAFFVAVAKVYALDLGLPPDWRIVDEVTADDLKSEAIARMLAEDDEDVWARLLRQLHSSARLRVHDAVLQTVKDCLEAFGESDARAWSAVQVPDGLLDEEELRAAIQAFEAADLPTNADGVTENANYANARSALIREIHSEKWREILNLKLPASALDGTHEYQRKVYSDELAAVILPLAQHAAACAVVKTVRKNETTYGFLEQFTYAHEELKTQESAYRFEDLPQRLALKDGTDPLAEAEYDIWYRIDGRVDHLLLDEFQDTSPIQYRILERIIKELLSDGTGERSLFCVGDVKQSIYGFREAEPRLLGRLHERHPILKEVKQALEESYRSSPVILETVNRVFEAVGSSVAFADDHARDAAEEFQEDFLTHTAARPARAGAAYLVEAEPPADGEKDWPKVLERTLARVLDIRAQEEHAQIGILLRTKKHLPELIYRLRDLEIRASGEGGNPLVDSAAVLQSLSVLHWLDHPGDTQASFHAATSILGASLEIPEKGDALDLLRDLRRRLVRDGYGAFLGALVPTVDAGYSDWDQRRFGQLVDLAHAYDARASLRPRAFVDFVRAERVEDPTASTVKVMTVHGSKGLEFDAVVLPELDGEFFPVAAKLFTARPDPYALIAEVSTAPDQTICGVSDDLTRLRYDHHRRGMIDNLCLLYVAMTRAKHRLDVVVKHWPQDKYPGKGLASVVRAALVDAETQADEKTGVLWAHDGSVEKWLDPKERQEVVEDEPAPMFALAETTTPRHLPRRAPSSLATPLLMDGAAIFTESGPAAARHGTLVHKLMEGVEWLETHERTDEDLNEALPSERPTETEAKDAIAAFHAALEFPEIQTLLARETQPAPEKVKVSNERPFALVLTDEEGCEYLANGSIDRLVLTLEGGAPTSAEVIDFKTDRITPDQVAEQAEHHAPQMNAYRRAVVAMYDLEPEQVSLRLAFLTPGVVHELT